MTGGSKNTGGKIILIGGGGHATSLAETFGSQLEGYIAPESSPYLNLPWLGNDYEAKDLIDEGNPFHMAFISTGIPSMLKRAEILSDYIRQGARFVSLIAPSAIVTPNSRIGSGSALMAGVILNKSVIGENSVVNTGSILEHDTVVGNNTFIGPGCVVGGFTTIGNNCFIGIGTKIRNGLRIADEVNIGMGSIVTKDILKPGLYYGVI